MPGRGVGVLADNQHPHVSKRLLERPQYVVPDGRYRRPAATSALRNSPIDAIWPAAGSSACAQPGSMMFRSGSAMASNFIVARGLDQGQNLSAERSVVSPAGHLPVAGWAPAGCPAWAAAGELGVIYRIAGKAIRERVSRRR